MGYPRCNNVPGNTVDPQQQLITLLFRLVFVACGALCASAMTIWRQYRRARYLKKALENEQQASISRVSEATQRPLKAFLQELKPTVLRLAEDTKTTWKLEP